MPPASRRHDGGRFRTETRATLTGAGDAVKGRKQQSAMALLQNAPSLTLRELGDHGVAVGTMRSLARRGVVDLTTSVVERDPFALAAGTGGWALDAKDHSDRPLTPEQALAYQTLESLADVGAFHTVLLHGVTGSGKTELYLRLAGHVLAAGRRVLILVPEIALTPAVAGAFRARFGPSVAIQHSGLSEGERHDQWHRIRRGEVAIVVGTRSAVFAPLDNVGLIVVDEEHDGAYKQEEAPRYNGRDVAVMRGRMAGALVVLGSATPSLESAFNAAEGRYGLVRLTTRVMDRPLADVKVVDMRGEFASEGPDVVLSRPLVDAMRERLAKREQAMILLNRRGFAVVVFCRSCGASIECPHCSVTLTYHRALRRLRCHYCNYRTRLPARCGECGGEYLEQSGVGTERLEAEVRQLFPDARVARVDRDTIKRRGALARLLVAVAAGEVDIVVGTQMIAKGHDFPAVTLVGVVSADVGLGLADFRVAERTFQLLTQVAGRAGRGETRGEALVQTLYPDHYSIRAAAAQDYAVFYARELEFRRAMHYPPVQALISILVKGRSLDAAMIDAQDLAQRVRTAGAGRVVGPAPAAREKIRDEYRAQLFLKGTRRRAMREAVLAAVNGRPDLRRRVVVDVDPMSVA
jgi:primosomal protein N' (replication factor Y)